jgi:hypothetical protein
MENLSLNWITEKYVDFEYKKYMLLGYLQHVTKNFDETKLYPHFNELIMHYKNVVDLRENKKALYDNFTSRMLGANMQDFKILYDKIIKDDDLMLELESIIEFSIPQFEKHMNEGKKIYDFIESQISLLPIGIMPLRVNEGYLFLHSNKQKEMKVYNYQVTIFESAAERYRGIHTTFVGSYQKDLSNTYEGIKRDVINYNKQLPNPATYVFETELELPVEPTFLPIAKRMLVKHVSL